MPLKEVLLKIFWGQLGRPSGLRGRSIGWLMTSANTAAYDLTLAHADIEAHDRILEIGFGTGALAEKALASAPAVSVRGVDASEIMVEMARNRLDRAIREGQADLRIGDVRSLPYASESSDKALCVHSIYFWRDPVKDLQEVQRVLVRGGLLIVTVDPADPMQTIAAKTTGYDRWSERALLTILEHSGLLTIGARLDAKSGLVCGWGRKASSC